MKTRISAFQLFASIIMIPYGSAVLFLVTPKAKQDSWIAMLIYILPGILLQLIYVKLWSKYPEDTIVTYMPKIFGKFLGYTISILYIIFFAYEAVRVARDIEGLILIFTIPKMPILIIGLIFMVTVTYGAYKGVECIIRFSCLVLAVIVGFIIAEWLFLYMTPDAIKIKNLKPYLEEGWVNLIAQSWKLITYPYGETVLSVMLYPFVKEKLKVRTASVWAIIVQGILLSINAVMFISVLGVSVSGTALFPLFYAARFIRFSEIFDKLEILVVLLMVVACYVKVSYFMYGSIIGTAQLLKLKDPKYLAIPFGIIVFIGSIFVASNYPEHIYIGQVLTLTYVHLPMAVIIPIIALITYYIKAFVKKMKKDKKRFSGGELLR